MNKPEDITGVGNNPKIDSAMPQRVPAIPKGNLGGRSVTYLKGGIQTLTTGFVDWANDIDVIITTTKFLFYAFAGVQMADCGTNTCVTNLVGSMDRSAELLEWTRLGEDFPGLTPKKITQDIDEKKYLKIPAKVLFAIADVGATFLLLAECGWDKLGECAHLMGQIPVFGTLGLSVLNVTCITAITGYTFLTLDTAMTIGRKMTENKDCTKEWVELASKITGLAFKMFVIAGCSATFPTVFVVWGLVSSGTGIISFFVTKYYDKQEEQQLMALQAAKTVVVTV